MRNHCILTAFLDTIVACACVGTFVDERERETQKDGKGKEDAVVVLAVALAVAGGGALSWWRLLLLPLLLVGTVCLSFFFPDGASWWENNPSTAVNGTDPFHSFRQIPSCNRPTRIPSDGSDRSRVSLTRIMKSQTTKNGFEKSFWVCARRNGAAKR